MLVRRLASCAISAILSLTLIASSAPAVAITGHSPSLTRTPSEYLALLKVAPERNSTSYVRAYFKHWIDADRDGCDTRREVLERQSLVKTDCKSLRNGSWYSEFDGVLTRDAGTFDIDHFIPLKEAWESGAYAWNADTRMRFANDLEYQPSLIAVTASSNRSKSDRDPAAWLPPNAGYTCPYLARWVAVKFRWRLTVDEAEKSAIASKLKVCDSWVRVPKPKRAAITLGN